MVITATRIFGRSRRRPVDRDSSFVKLYSASYWPRIFLSRPSLTSATGWKIVAFIGLGVLPALCLVGGMNAHVQRSEQTRFCVSCHVMIPYGQSLYVDDPSHIPAQHFQNHRVPARRWHAFRATRTTPFTAR